MIKFFRKKGKDWTDHVADELISDTDPDGWYTGVTSTAEYDEPVQDADDL